MMNADLRRPGPALALLLAMGCGGGSNAPASAPSAAPAAPSAAQQEADRIKLLEEAQAREKAERKKRRDAMRAMGTATVTKKAQLGKGKDVKLELEFEFKNVGQKELAAAEGAIEIRDPAGTVLLKSLKVPFLGPIKPGATTKKSGKFPTDPGKPTDVTLVKTPLKDLQLNWIPQLYRFTDGTTERGE